MKVQGFDSSNVWGKPRQRFIVRNSPHADVNRRVLGSVEACERFENAFAVDVAPKRAAGYESRSPVATNLSYCEQITYGERVRDLRQYFRREFVDGSQDVGKCLEFWDEVGKVSLHPPYLRTTYGCPTVMLLMRRLTSARVISDGNGLKIVCQSRRD